LQTKNLPTWGASSFTNLGSVNPTPNFPFEDVPDAFLEKLDALRSGAQTLSFA